MKCCTEERPVNSGKEVSRERALRCALVSFFYSRLRRNSQVEFCSVTQVNDVKEYGNCYSFGDECGFLNVYRTPPISFFVGFTKMASTTAAAIATAAPMPNKVGNDTVS